MKIFFYILFLITGFNANAQSKQERIAMYKTTMLENTVFGSKDSATLEKLFARTLHYEHSNGKVQSREEALMGILRNRSSYKEDIQPFPYNVSKEGDSLIVKHRFKAIETKEDQSVSVLDLTITTVWIKEGGDWKLARRKAIKND